MIGDASITLFLSGDVMTGRGVDQVLAHPSAPRLFEQYAASALDYVALAERASGPIPRGVEPAYVWGAALEVLDAARPDARIINLETALTTSEDAEPKGINYRMHPANVDVLTAARIDCCVLANNHVLDWGVAGLVETLATLGRAGIRTAGAGADAAAARAPAALELPGHAARVLVVALGATDSGVPPHWAAAPGRPGVWVLEELTDASAAAVARVVEAARRAGDVVVASIHWGGNWGYRIPDAHRRFAHALIERAGVDVVHGHSSHHAKAIEVHRGRPILYGCGDLLHDYEGIAGYERYRNDLVALYLLTLDTATGQLLRLRIVPLQVRRFRLEHPSAADRAWFRDTLDRECARFGSRVAEGGEALELGWG
jgi:poly-gamma-glutamate synthesis protein (capsule biosynthesis protein)